MKTVPLEERCCKMVYHSNGNWGRSSQCTKRGIHEHDGKRYCGVHYPPNVEKRNQGWQAKYNAERVRSQWKSELEQAERGLIVAALQWKEDNSNDVDFNFDLELIQKIDAYITLRDNPR